MGHKPIVSLDRNNAGTTFIGLAEFDAEGWGVRAAVLAMADGVTHDAIMVRQFEDMARLMGDNVTTEVAAGFYPIAPIGMVYNYNAEVTA